MLNINISRFIRDHVWFGFYCIHVYYKDGKKVKENWAFSWMLLKRIWKTGGVYRIIIPYGEYDWIEEASAAGCDHYQMRQQT